MGRFADVPIEAVRSYWDARPCNIRHSPAPIGTREYFDQVEQRKHLVEPHIPGFADHAAWAGKRVLEIGCGIGTDTVCFARAGATVTAVDVSPRSLELARQRAEVYGLADRITFVCADAEQLSQTLPVEPYDLVYSFGVLHHTPHIEQALAEACSYAAPGGTVKVMVYHRRSWKVLSIVLRRSRGCLWRAAELVAEESEAQTGCPVTYTFTRRSGRRLLERAGLRVDAVEVHHIFNWRIVDYVEYRYVQAAPLRYLPAPLFRRLERVLGWHLCLTATAR